MQSRSDRLTRVEQILAVLWSVAIVALIAAAVLGTFGALAFHFSHTFKHFYFNVVGDIDGGDTPSVEIISQCTNATGDGTITRIDRGDNITITYACSQSKNPCEINVCLENRTCEVQFIPGGNCSTSEQCVTGFDSPSWKCDMDTCQCMFQPLAIINNTCILDTDCLNIVETQCLDVKCVNGRCTENQTAGTQCFSNIQCISALGTIFAFCNPATCTCAISSLRPGFGQAFTRANLTSTGDPIPQFTMGHAQSGIIKADWIMIGNWSGGVRVGNALTNTGVLQGVSFANDTYTIVDGGTWNFAIQVQGAKATGTIQQRTWALATRRNVATTTVNQATTPVESCSVMTFDAVDQILTTVGVTTFTCSPGDTIRFFAMMSFMGGGSLADVDVYDFWVLAQKFPT